MARLLGITRFWNYISDWIECRVHLRPEKDNTIDLGSRDYRWRTIYTGTAIGARVYNDAAFSHNSSGNWLAITFNSERFDTDGMHSTSSNTSRVYAITAGTYLLTGHANFAANSTGYRQLGLRVDGATFIGISAANNIGSGASLNLSVGAVYELTANQYVELCAWQNSGGTLAIAAWDAFTPEFAMVRLP